MLKNFMVEQFCSGVFVMFDKKDVGNVRNEVL
jgi:hypothetical protein